MIDVPMVQLVAFCRRWQIAEFALFGSALREDFNRESDVDVLVTFLPGAHPGIDDYWRMERELESLFGRKVDLVYRRVIERDPNYLLRRAILESAKTIYVA